MSNKDKKLFQDVKNHSISLPEKSKVKDDAATPGADNKSAVSSISESKKGLKIILDSLLKGGHKNDSQPVLKIRQLMEKIK